MIWILAIIIVIFLCAWALCWAVGRADKEMEEIMDEEAELWDRIYESKGKIDEPTV